MDPLSTWAKDREKTIEELTCLGETINTHARNAKKASVVGTGTSIVSGVGAAICYLIAPVTFGASLIPAIAFTGVSIAGAATSVGSSFINYLIERGYMKDVQIALDKDRASFDALREFVEMANRETAVDRIESAKNIGIKIPAGIKIGTEIGSQIAKKLSVSEKAAATLLKLGKTARFAGHVAVFIALPLDIIFFIRDAIDLAKGNVSAAADEVLKLARQLQREYDEIMSDVE